MPPVSAVVCHYNERPIFASFLREIDGNDWYIKERIGRPPSVQSPVHTVWRVRLLSSVYVFPQMTNLVS